MVTKSFRNISESTPEVSKKIIDGPLSLFFNNNKESILSIINSTNLIINKDYNKNRYPLLLGFDEEYIIKICNILEENPEYAKAAEAAAEAPAEAAAAESNADANTNQEDNNTYINNLSKHIKNFVNKNLQGHQEEISYFIYSRISNFFYIILETLYNIMDNNGKIFKIK